ncbi:MAG: polyprenyl synthetase family protein [Cellulomonadaceae bacterium]|nr:polyprenyl synthetase family protein [Cellulomonadaceae bacterium]
MARAAEAAPAFPLPDVALAERLVERMGAVEEALLDAAQYADRLAADASRYLMAAGGKRLRPFLTLLASELGAGPNQDVLDAAVVVELTHLATLYHDDVQDSASMRRGTPTAHTVWGNTVAIMVGDLLFARASQRVARLGTEAVRLQAETFERLCLGQLAELTGPGERDDPVAHYLTVLSNKTASLVATSARFGAMFGGAPSESFDVLSAYGEKVGVAFQLADDVLDLASTGAETGKTPGTDLREHVPTMPVLLLRQRVARGLGGPEDEALIARLDGDISDDDTLAEIVEELRAHEVLAETRALAVTWAHDAAAELDPLPEGPVKEALVSFALALADRAS